MKRIFYVLIFLFALFYRSYTGYGSIILQQKGIDLDTNRILYDFKTQQPLRYYQYFKLLKTEEYTIFHTNSDEDGTAYIGDKLYIIKSFVPPPPNKQIATDSLLIVKRLQNFFSRHEAKSLSGLDTSLLVYNETGAPLRYYQYTKLMSTGRYTILLEQGKRSLQLIPGMKQMDSISINNKIYFSLTRADKILVKKAMRRMSLLRGGKVIFEFPVNLGRNPIGHKQKEGDGRTPEGSYYLTGEAGYEKDYYLGYVISYPDAKDIANAKKNNFVPGGEVMIHGTNPKKSKLKDWTNGCIAISNAHMDTLSKYMSRKMAVEIRK